MVKSDRFTFIMWSPAKCVLFPSARLADEMHAIVNGVIFFVILACSAIVAFNLFALESNEALSMETTIAMYDMGSVLAVTFLYCYLSDNVTQSLLTVSDAFYYSTWYKGALRRDGIYLIVPIQRAQREVRLVAFNLIECSLMVFLRVGANAIENH